MEEDPSFSARIKIFFVRFWKIILIVSISAVLLLTAFLLILFLVILKPSSAVTITPVIPQATTVTLPTVIPSTPGTILMSTGPVIPSTVPPVTVPPATVPPVKTTVAQTTVTRVKSTQTVVTVPIIKTTVTQPGPTGTQPTVTQSGSTVPLTTVVQMQTTTPQTTVTQVQTTITQGGSTAQNNLSTTPGPTNDPTLTCTDGYTLTNGKCWMLTFYTTPRDLTDTLCFSRSGGTLPTIMNSQQNDEMAPFVTSQQWDKVWIALKCDTNDKSSCKWDYNQGGIDGYSNFAPGHPNVTIGPCVYYNVSTKLWISGVCDSDNWRFGMVCELPATRTDTCKNNYNNNCYIENNLILRYDKAQDACKRQCGSLLSIHSALENRFVSSIYEYYSQSMGGTLLLGAVAASQDMIVYSDYSTEFSYNNMRNFTLDKNCVFYDIVSGDWFSDDCTNRAISICKRPVGVNC